MILLIVLLTVYLVSLTHLNDTSLLLLDFCVVLGILWIEIQIQIRLHQERLVRQHQGQPQEQVPPVPQPNVGLPDLLPANIFQRRRQHGRQVQ